MIRLTAHVSGRVQRVGFRAKVVSLANEMDLAGLIQNRPDGSVLVIAEGQNKDNLERFASAIAIKNTLIHVENVSAEYSPGSGQYSTFRKITGPDEVGERLDDGIEILKRMLDKQDQTILILSGMDKKMDRMLDKQDQALGKMDQMLDKHDETVLEIRDLREDLARRDSGERLVRMEKDIRTIKSKLGIR